MYNLCLKRLTLVWSHLFVQSRWSRIEGRAARVFSNANWWCIRESQWKDQQRRTANFYNEFGHVMSVAPAFMFLLKK